MLRTAWRISTRLSHSALKRAISSRQDSTSAAVLPAIKASGVSLVIAKSFARIFYRNSINIGLAIVECPEAVDGISEGDRVEADMDNGIIRNLTTGKEYKTAPFPEFIQKIIENNGLIESISKGVIE